MKKLQECGKSVHEFMLRQMPSVCIKINRGNINIIDVKMCECFTNACNKIYNKTTNKYK